MEEYLRNFLKDEVFLDLIDQLDESVLDSLKITQTGARLKLLKASKEYSANKKGKKKVSIDSISVLGSTEKPKGAGDVDLEQLQKELQSLLSKV